MIKCLHLQRKKQLVQTKAVRRVLRSKPRASRGVQNTTGIWGATWCMDGPRHIIIIRVRKHTNGRTAFHQQKKGYIQHKKQRQQQNLQMGGLFSQDKNSIFHELNHFPRSILTGTGTGGEKLGNFIGGTVARATGLETRPDGQRYSFDQQLANFKDNFNSKGQKKRTGQYGTKEVPKKESKKKKAVRTLKKVVKRKKTTVSTTDQTQTAWAMGG